MNSPFAVKLVRLKFPDNIAGEITISGHTLSADRHGWVEMPPALVDQCRSHGFKTEDDLAAEERELNRLAAAAAQPPARPVAQAAAARR